jgi:outer membrane murein-binding lipoprotein Lpp
MRLHGTEHEAGVVKKDSIFYKILKMRAAMRINKCRAMLGCLVAVALIVLGCENKERDAVDLLQGNIEKLTQKINDLNLEIQKTSSAQSLLEKEQNDLKNAFTSVKDDANNYKAELISIQRGELTAFRDDLTSLQKVIDVIQQTVIHAGWFDGKGGHITVPASPDFNFNGDFTVELFFMRSPNSPNNFNLIKSVSNQDWNKASAGDYMITLGGDNGVYCYVKGAGNTSGNSVADINWHHLALVRSKNRLTQYVDGMPGSGALTLPTPIGNTQPLIIALPETHLTSNYFCGWIREVRISGIARYSSTFTPPVKAFTQDENTRFLLHLNLNSVTESTSTTSRRTPARVSTR